MSLSSGIYFRFLDAQLTDEERKTLIAELAVSNSSLIIKSLFHFVQTSMAADDLNDAERINKTMGDIAADIIRSRNTSDGAPSTTTCSAFDQLPLHLIGLSASYLDPTSYAQLTVCCRATYLGLSVPNQIAELEIEHFSPPFVEDVVDLSPFPSVERLLLNKGVFPQLLGINDDRAQSRFNRLKYIKIESDLPETRRMVEAFRSAATPRNRALFESVKYIHFEDWLETQISVRQFLDFVGFFPNLEFVGFSEYILFDGDWAELVPFFLSLKGLDVECHDGNEIVRRLLPFVASHLQSLSLMGCGRETDHFLEGMQFDNLRELKIEIITDYMNVLDVMVESTRCIRLKKVLFRIIILGEEEPEDARLPEMEDAVRTLLATSDSLQFLELDLMPSPDTGALLILSALKAIERGIGDLLRDDRGERTATDRDFLKIRIRGEFLSVEEAEEGIATMHRIVDNLCETDLRDWMLICDVRPLSERKELDGDDDREVSMFELPRIEQRPEYSPDINGDGEEMHIFYNVGCKINGYSESWMMQ